MLRLDYLSCFLTILSTVLIGKKLWQGWVVAGANSIIICVIGMQTAEFGFLAANLFCIGLYGAITKRNAIAVLMGIEIMLNAVNITMVGFSFFNSVPRYSTYLTGQIFAIFIITVAAAEAAVALAMIIAIYRKRNTVDVGEINVLKF